MTSPSPRLSYTDVELRSYLPSGWGIVPGAVGSWSAERSAWQIEVYDGADNTWTISVTAAEAAQTDRFAALRAAIDRLQRKSLGRKSVLTG